MSSGNPFTFDKPLTPERMVGRSAEAALLLELAEGGHNVRLSSPRRYGKTTLLKRLIADATNIGIPSVYVDFSKVRSLEEVERRLRVGYSASRSWPEGVVDWLRARATLKVRAGGGGMGGEVTVAHTDRSVLAQIERWLRLSERIHRKRGAAVIVILDEFQDLLRVDDAIDGVFRSVIQHQQDCATYVFAGSQPGLMEELFSNSERPLYGQSRSMQLPPLADWELAHHLESAFGEAGRKISTVLPDFLGVVRGHPQKTMMLAHHLWELSDGPALPNDLERAISAVMRELDAQFRYQWQNSVTAEQRRALVGLLAGGVFDQAAMYQMERGGHVVIADVGPEDWTVVDPFFERWIRRRLSPVASEAEAPEAPAGVGNPGPGVIDQTFGGALFATRERSALPVRFEVADIDVGDPVVIVSRGRGSRLGGSGKVVAVQPTLVPELSSDVLYVALADGRIAALPRARIRRAGGEVFARALLLRVTTPAGPAPHIPTTFDRVFAEELLDLATTVGALNQRNRVRTLSLAEAEQLNVARLSLEPELAAMLGVTPRDARRSVERAMRAGR